MILEKEKKIELLRRYNKALRKKVLKLQLEIKELKDGKKNRC